MLLQEEMQLQDSNPQKIKQYVKDGSLPSFKSKVMGMAILDRSLFVVCQNPPNVISKFDLDAPPNGSSETRVTLCVSEMVWPRGMAASQTLGCLYITDWSTMSGGKLWRYKYKTGEETRAEGPVADLTMEPFGVSVSPKNDNVLVTCAPPINVWKNRGRIVVYKPIDGKLVNDRTIDLADLEIPRHSILTSSSQFIVCHGWTSLYKHGVTSFKDLAGSFVVQEKHFFGAEGGGSGERDMYAPLSLACYENQMILVVDYYNHRILQLTENIQFVGQLLTKDQHSLEYPRHVCRDPTSGRLFVGQENGTVQIFKEC